MEPGVYIGSKQNRRRQLRQCADAMEPVRLVFDLLRSTFPARWHVPFETDKTSRSRHGDRDDTMMAHKSG